jgi:alkylation response protein AidB-like acyl-CoA dehydrogenase
MLPEASAANVIGNGAALIPAAPAFGVRAVCVEGGYRLTGRWAYNSGAPNADWIAIPAGIFDGDQPHTGEDGPEMVFAFVHPSQVEIIDTWYVTGLRASGTQDLYIDDVFVPDEMAGLASWGPLGQACVSGARLRSAGFRSCRWPAWRRFRRSASVSLGAPSRSSDSLRLPSRARLAGRVWRSRCRLRPGWPRLKDCFVQRVRAGTEVQMLWDIAVNACPITLEHRAAVRIASLTATMNCVAVVDLLYRLAGSSAIFQSSPLDRCFRDVHTAAQHLQVQGGRRETTGRVLFGLDPASPVL